MLPWDRNSDAAIKLVVNIVTFMSYQLLLALFKSRERFVTLLWAKVRYLAAFAGVACSRWMHQDRQQC